MTDIDCVSCERDLDHCHGTLVGHVDGRVDCTEPDCFDVDRARHDLVIDCDDRMFDGCGCVFGPADVYGSVEVFGPVEPVALRAS